MTYDPIPDLVGLGYTWREAAFLYLVGRTSGVFLGRQYSRFLQRKPGALILQFVERAERLGHVAVLEYGQRRHVYHLKSRTVYRILGDEESQNRRAKGDHEIKTRLMVLDYILERLPEAFLCDAIEKATFFQESLGISKAHLPSSAFPSRRGTVLIPFADRYPIYIESSLRDRRPIQFTYFDHGTCTVKPFIRHLEKYQPLLECLTRFELTYIAVSPRNVAAAETVFNRHYPDTTIDSDLLPNGRDHLLKFFKTQCLWDRNDPTFSPEHLMILREGEKVYVRREHEQLKAAWLSSAEEFDTTLMRICGKSRPQGRFTTFILDQTYPVFGTRYHGKPAENEVNSQIEAISKFSSIAS
jgi:hypothetical protein